MSITDCTERELALSSQSRSNAFRRSIEAKAAALRELQAKRADEATLASLTRAIDVAPAKPTWFEIVSVGAPTMAEIKRATCAYFGHLTIAEMISERRHHRLIFPRQIAMFLCCRLTRFTRSVIGTSFANRDPTTVLHACQKINQLLGEGNEAIAAAINAICIELDCEPLSYVDMMTPRSCGSDAEVTRLWKLGFDTATIARKTRRLEATIAERLNTLRETARAVE